MKILFKYLVIFLLQRCCTGFANAQQPQFHIQIDEKGHHFGTIYGFAQDQQGYIWLGSFAKGLVRYNGKDFKIFRHQPENPKSPASQIIISIAVDHSGMIWFATFGNGVDKYDPVTNRFTHFRYNTADSSGIRSDTTFSVIVDRKGKLWKGSDEGIDTLNARDAIRQVSTVLHGVPADHEHYRPKISVATKKLSDKIEITITDNGTGIPRKIIDKIFQPFFTTKPTGQGTGLGLSLSYDIVKSHGGELRVESLSGETSGQAAVRRTKFIIQLRTN